MTADRPLSDPVSALAHEQDPAATAAPDAVSAAGVEGLHPPMSPDLVAAVAALRAWVNDEIEVPAVVGRYAFLLGWGRSEARCLLDLLELEGPVVPGGVA